MYKFNIILWTSLFACAVCNCLLIEVLGKDKKKSGNLHAVGNRAQMIFVKLQS